MSKLRVLIVDDEALARRGIRARLAAMEDAEIVGECGSGRRAVEAIETLRPNLVMLDVQMPELDGFDVIEAVGLDRMPLTIFVTAYDSHAIRAFDAQALDYLLKPIDSDRFAVAIERARARLAESSAKTRAAALEGALAQATHRRRIALRDGGRVILLETSEIDWVSADGDYVRVHVKGRSHLVRHTIAAMEARLNAEEFARIHRSTIVNLGRVAELRRRGERDYVVVLRDGTKLNMSRAYREALALPGVPPRL